MIAFIVIATLLNLLASTVCFYNAGKGKDTSTFLISALIYMVLTGWGAYILAGAI